MSGELQGSPQSDFSLSIEETEQLLRRQVTLDPLTAGRVLNIGRDATYRAIKDGSLPSIQIGGRKRVPTLPLLRLLGLEPEERQPLRPTAGNRPEPSPPIAAV